MQARCVQAACIWHQPSEVSYRATTRSNRVKRLNDLVRASNERADSKMNAGVVGVHRHEMEHHSGGSLDLVEKILLSRGVVGVSHEGSGRHLEFLRVVVDVRSAESLSAAPLCRTTVVNGIDFCYTTIVPLVRNKRFVVSSRPLPVTHLMKQRKHTALTDEKKPVGRPRVSEDERLIMGALRLNRGQWETFEAMGGVAWLRTLLDRSTSAHGRKT